MIRDKINCCPIPIDHMYSKSFSNVIRYCSVDILHKTFEYNTRKINT